MKCLRCGATAPPNLTSSLCPACMAAPPKAISASRKGSGCVTTFFIAIAVVIFGGFFWLMHGCFQALDAGTGQPPVNIGDYAYVTDQMWCMQSKEALSELQDFAARNATDEANRVFLEKGVTILSQGSQVKVLDSTLGGSVKVRTANGEECWTVYNILRESQ